MALPFWCSLSLMTLPSEAPALPYPGYQKFSRGTREDLSAEGRQRAAKPREKPLAKSALIYRAGWTLKLPLKCQSQRWFPTKITCTGTWRNGRSGFNYSDESCQMLLSVRARVVLLNGFRGSQNNSREKGSACEFGVLPFVHPLQFRYLLPG